MNTQIQPFKTGFPEQEATQIAINVLLSLGGESSTSHWTLLTANGQTIATDNIEIPKEVHSLWGTDDSVITDYVLQELQLTKK
jgi:hypothetical protein